jgi:hypothetical protein
MFRRAYGFDIGDTDDVSPEVLVIEGLKKSGRFGEKNARAIADWLFKIPVEDAATTAPLFSQPMISGAAVA